MRSALQEYEEGCGTVSSICNDTIHRGTRNSNCHINHSNGLDSVA